MREVVERRKLRLKMNQSNLTEFEKEGLLDWFEKHKVTILTCVFWALVERDTN